MPRTLLNISYCQTHAKGGDNIGHLNGSLHALWLEQAVQFYRRYNFPIFVSVTGLPGILYVEAGHERDALWRVMKHATILGHQENPGHQVGAALTIRLGLEAAGKMGYDFMVHTAEDVMPRPGVVENFVQQLEAGHEYAGEKWGVDKSELNSQFFACRVGHLCSVWDACAISGSKCIESYLEERLRGKSKWLGNESLYRTTHNFDEWKLWAEEQKHEINLQEWG